MYGWLMKVRVVRRMMMMMISFIPELTTLRCTSVFVQRLLL